jgi:hypothetical protein
MAVLKFERAMRLMAPDAVGRNFTDAEAAGFFSDVGHVLLIP